ncbi:Leucine-rich repeat typical subtype [Penicillium herquei]|nr:Leucine-rich repeat typical subtype [Penicillium herquei]
MEGQPKVNRPPSGIPRLASRLPLPTSTASKSVHPSPSRDRLRADPGLDDRRLRRPSYESLLKKPTTRYSPAKPRTEVLPSQEERPGEDGANTPDEAGSMIGDDESVSGEIRGRTRPSLSERTIETLAHIPPSPASVQRQSSFFNGTSPIRSPSRTPSNVSSYSRSPSRSSSHQTTSSDLLSQPVSKLRLPSRSRMSLASASELPTTVVEPLQSPSRLKQPSKRRSLAALSTASGNSVPPKKTIAPPKSSTVRPTPSTVSKPSNSNMGPPERPLNVRKTRKPQTDSPSSLRSPSTASRYVSAASTFQDELTPEQQAESESRKASKSSSALRETIAKAKAARKAVAATEKTNEPLPQTKVAVTVESWSNMDDDDPFNQLPKGSSDIVLRKRVGGARSSGTLNIAALSLKEIPQEVITMYEFDPESASNWFENVDLVKFIAADNELSELPDAVFPDINLEDFDPESDERGPQFGGIETLDLHGNILHSLPIGIRRLNQLRSLNLSNNAIGMNQLTKIVEITSLVDLKLASNKLEGPLLPALCSLTKLESLDLRGNALTELPNELGELKFLRILDVAENRLSSLPFEALSKVPLVTLNAPKNNLNGTLIPASVDRLEKLQSLNIACNTIEVFAANNMLSLPSLHSLLLSVNRITSLPCLSSWQSLLLLSADDNSIAEIPAGFVDLKNLKTADFTGNNITRLDEKIGFMEKLSSLRIANNPLRERKLLTMDTEDIKQDMRNRCEPDPQDTDDEGSVATQFTLAPETPALESGWRIKPGGVLDRSYADLTDLEAHKLELINAQEVRNLYAQHNELRIFPAQALAVLSQTLIELDLSHNAMSSSEYLTSPLELPKLQTLNISATSVTTLEPLLANLKAPSLTFLDISNNRLTGALPHIRLIYPEVKTVLASDNQLSRLEFEAVQGLQVLDVSNNDIDSLPSKIGLLGAERSAKNWGSGSALRRFEVAGNRFRVPRWQTVAKGTDAVLEFLREHIPEHDLPEWEREDEIVEEY